MTIRTIDEILAGDTNGLQTAFFDADLIYAIADTALDAQIGCEDIPIDSSTLMQATCTPALSALVATHGGNCGFAWIGGKNSGLIGTHDEAYDAA